MRKKIHYVVEDIDADHEGSTLLTFIHDFFTYLVDSGICCESSGLGCDQRTKVMKMVNHVVLCFDSSRRLGGGTMGAVRWYDPRYDGPTDILSDS
jgi:hypothetical protein